METPATALVAPTPSGCRYFLPWSAADLSARQIQDTLDELETHVLNLRTSRFIHAVLDAFPQGAHAMAVSAEIDDSGDESYLWVQADAFAQAASGKLVKMDEQDIAADFHNEMPTGNPDFTTWALQELTGQPRTREQFLALDAGLWSQASQAARHAAVLEKALPEPPAAAPRPRV